MHTHGQNPRSPLRTEMKCASNNRSRMSVSESTISTIAGPSIAREAVAMASDAAAAEELPPLLLPLRCGWGRPPTGVPALLPAAANGDVGAADGYP